MPETTTLAERPPFAQADFTRQPFVLAWELTRACNLACVHCRAEAQLRRNPNELTTDEALRFIDDVAGFDAPPTLILTGGDPLRRPDVLDLIGRAAARGIRATLTPAGTPLATKARLAAAQEAGLSRVAFSLDGSTAERHDAFRRVDGSYGWTLDAIRAAGELGLPVQIHSTLCERTVDDLPALADLADELGAVVWAVFCLVPTGRAEAGDAISAERYEEIFAWLAERSRSARWALKLTEGYHYRRVLAQIGRDPLHRPPTADGVGRAPGAVNAGNGFCFVSHIGEVCPSGFLPIVAGNVRRDSIVDLYQTHPLFQELRNPDLLKGKCGACEFKRLCGGSRSRAYAQTGDYLASDPACAYVPPGYSTEATGFAQ
ncbi:MAG: TIGR04053 family radical SAM/SPASM domain-containing protein [Thermomicrobiales bacterium]|nr:TIGR04053 family radical SAM/SPASM domain-containing protein [Thermomicrobiales bacterium]